MPFRRPGDLYIFPLHPRAAPPCVSSPRTGPLTSRTSSPSAVWRRLFQTSTRNLICMTVYARYSKVRAWCGTRYPIAYQSSGATRTTPPFPPHRGPGTSRRRKAGGPSTGSGRDWSWSGRDWSWWGRVTHRVPDTAQDLSRTRVDGWSKNPRISGRSKSTPLVSPTVTRGVRRPREEGVRVTAV